MIEQSHNINGTAPPACGATGNTAYGDGFALAYDALMREDYSYSRYADYINSVFEKYGNLPEPIIADLGCGTGSLCVELAARGFDVIGIDNSPQMLNEARQKASDKGFPEILYLEQELDEIELFGSVGAFVSTVDSLNYITDKRRLKRMFKLIDNYLAPGGLFIFDVNTEHKLAEVIGNKFFYEITDSICYLWRNSYNRSNKTSEFDLTLFMRGAGGQWQRSDEIHTQRAYSRKEFQEAARGTGLDIQGVYKFLSFRSPAGKDNKISYVIKKIRAGVV